jgi:hypothetical protein
MRSLPQLPLEAGLVNPVPPPGGSRWDDDVLVADQSDHEGRVDMVGSASGQYYLVNEGMEAGNACINLYRSGDGGRSWWHYFYVCGTGGNDITQPTIEVPEFAENYLFLSFVYMNSIVVMRIDLATGDYSSSTVDYSLFGVRDPHLTDDNQDYDSYWLYITYIWVDGVGERIARAARSRDLGATWEDRQGVGSGAATSVDIAYAEGALYLSSAGLSEAEPPFVHVARSMNFATSWQSTAAAGEGVSCSVAAVADGHQVAVLYEGLESPGIYCSCSLDQGVTWTNAIPLYDIPDWEERFPNLAVDPTRGRFHAVFWAQDRVIYRNAPCTNPITGWGEVQTLNDTGQARDYRPAIAVAGGRGLPACVAWCDARTPTDATYADRGGFLPPADHLYAVDFGSPPHTVGQPPVTGTGPAPRLTPTQVKFGDPTVVTGLGDLAAQPCQFGNGTTGYDQLEFAVDPSHAQGFDIAYEWYHVEFDLLVDNLVGSGTNNAFSLLLDLPYYHRIDFHENGEVWLRQADSAPVFVDTFALDRPIFVEATVEIAPKWWLVTLDGVTVYANFTHPTTDGLHTLRLHLDGDHAADAVAVDNLHVYGCFPLGSGVGEPGDRAPNGGPAVRLEAQPNPACDGVRLRWDAATSRPVRWTVLSADGRHVWSAGASPDPAGGSELSWDGRDTGGRPVPAGAYFVRAFSGGRTLGTRRLLIVR